eukprot:CAMPEP_0206291646 /NCGR_PEP_ID=MMETSP0106_2-20121207/3226_1 /ASSEMBLY_ACC=CAM_ASM_000206 /TAXON_ID=81532 /ORGANISM="Acanthoeca-like sp., Strain 10tr" /LENGTH=89 /DNA_ID=CAMNT_0053722211 /DNA_START=201 /DNA_END=470 /DNA_ORIENTATION=-
MGRTGAPVSVVAGLAARIAPSAAVIKMHSGARCYTAVVGQLEIVAREAVERACTVASELITLTIARLALQGRGVPELTDRAHARRRFAA